MNTAAVLQLTTTGSFAYLKLGLQTKHHIEIPDEKGFGSQQKQVKMSWIHLTVIHMLSAFNDLSVWLNRAYLHLNSLTRIVNAVVRHLNRTYL